MIHINLIIRDPPFLLNSKLLLLLSLKSGFSAGCEKRGGGGVEAIAMQMKS